MVCSLDETMNTFMETCNDTEMNSTFNFSLKEVHSILLEHRHGTRILDKNTEVCLNSVLPKRKQTLNNLKFNSNIESAFFDALKIV